jgi:hypothetical protein
MIKLEWKLINNRMSSPNNFFNSQLQGKYPRGKWRSITAQHARKDVMQGRTWKEIKEKP